ncbi:MAG: hypothetical protein KDK62_00975 [Chlamydiia bacterium]|nr:hypothetical protein [Chlamydiia bacterium]
MTWFQFIRFQLKDNFTIFKRYPGFTPQSFFLSLLYFFKNPFRVSKSFWVEKGADEVDVYGETPLVTLDKIAARAALSKEDTFFDLGMGRGKGALFIKHKVGCKVVGLEIIPNFVKKAERVKRFFGLKDIWFLLKDLTVADLSRGTVFYLYGNFLSDETLLELGKKLDELPKGTKVISVSFPISDYTHNFKVQESFEGEFPWGKTDIFISKY